MTLAVAGPVQYERVRDRSAAGPAGFAPEPQAGETGERAGLVLALAAHATLFALLSLAWGAQPPRAWPKPQPIEVSLVEDVALDSVAPAAPTPPAPSVAPDQGAPEEAPPPPPAPVAKPEPVQPAPPKPAPAPAPKPKPAPEPVAVAKPAPAPKPAPKPAPVKPAPSKASPAEKPAPPAPAKPTPAKAAASPAKSSRLAGLLPAVAAGAKAEATATRPRGRRLGDDILAGLSPDAPSKKPSAAAPGAKAGPYPTASIVQAIARQIQPCADRQVNPGPGANRIVTTLNVRLNQDGTLAATPRMVRQSGVTDENERYAQRVVDLGVAAFKGCTPLKLPSELFSTPSGGWEVINYQWQLR